MSRFTLAWAAIALLTISACSGGASSASPEAQPSSGAEQVSQVDLLNTFVPATGVEFGQGTKFSSERSRLLSALTNKCMEKSGFSFPVRTGEFQLFNNVEFPDMERIGREKQLVPGGPTAGVAEGSQGGGSSIPEGQEEAYRALATKCQDASAESFAKLDAIGYALEKDWLDEVNRIQASEQVLAARSEFSSCATNAGVPAVDAATFETFMAWVTGEMTKVTSKQLQAKDREWAEVFIQCAGETVQLQESLQVEAKEKFVQAKFGQIQELEKVANTEIGEARAELAVR